MALSDGENPLDFSLWLGSHKQAGMNWLRSDHGKSRDELSVGGPNSSYQRRRALVTTGPQVSAIAPEEAMLNVKLKLRMCS
jgi:hypothetical protein